MRFSRTMLIGTASLAAMLGAAQAALAADAPAANGGTVEELVVTGIRQSLQKSLETKRNADAIVDAITAEDIGKFPDSNVAESLSRIPGVTVDHAFGQGEKVSILGTDPALNRTLLNGQTVASADWFILDTPGRTFNYTLLAPEVVGRADVYKSPEARVDEGSIGGTVVINTRKALDLPANTISGQVGYVYNDRSGDGNPALSLLYSWKNPDQTFGVVASYQHAEDKLRRDGFETYGTMSGADYLANAQGCNPAPATPGAACTPGTLARVAAIVGNNLTARGPNSLASSFFQQDRKRDGFTLGVQYHPNDKLAIDLDGLYVKASYDNYNQSDYAFMSPSANALTGMTVSNGVITGATFANTSPADCIVPVKNSAGAVTGSAPGNCVGQSYLDVQDRKSDVKTYAVNLKGSYDFGDGWLGSAQLGTTKATGGTKQQYFAEFAAQGGYSYSIAGTPGGAPTLNYATNVQQDPTQWKLGAGWDGNFLRQPTSDKESYAQADVTKSLSGPITSFQVGLKYRDHETSQRSEQGSISNLFTTLAQIGPGMTPGDYLDGFSGVSQDMKNRVTLNKGAWEQFVSKIPLNTGSGGFNGYSPQYNSTFNVEEKVTAGYAQANFNLEGLRGNVGVRIVHTEQVSQGFNVDTNNKATAVSVTNSYDNVLPSLNVAYNLRDDLILRFSAAQVMARANYADLTPFLSQQDTVHTGSGGNPNLKPYKASNVDATVEWYFQPGAYLAGQVFYKDISNYVVAGTVSEQHFNITTGTVDPYTISRPSNAGAAEVKGFAVSYQQNYAYGFGLVANYTYSDASTDIGTPLPYNSKNQINLTPFWEQGPFSARVSYSWRSKYFTGIDRGDNMFVDEYTQLDASASWQFTKQLQLTVYAQNLLDEDYYSYANVKQQIRSNYRTGRQLVAAIHFKF